MPSGVEYWMPSMEIPYPVLHRRYAADTSLDCSQRILPSAITNFAQSSADSHFGIIDWSSEEFGRELMVMFTVLFSERNEKVCKPFREPVWTAFGKFISESIVRSQLA